MSMSFPVLGMLKNIWPLEFLACDQVIDFSWNSGRKFKRVWQCLQTLLEYLRELNIPMVYKLGF